MFTYCRTYDVIAGCLREEGSRYPYIPMPDTYLRLFIDERWIGRAPTKVEIYIRTMQDDNQKLGHRLRNYMRDLYLNHITQ